MLERLDDVPWSRLNHAYGSAEDVPALIRELAAGDAEARRKARWELYGNIFHQGTRYQATSYAVPFLLELLRADGAADRAELLELLAAISVGYDEWLLPDTIPIAEWRQDADGGAELFDALTAEDEDADDFDALEDADESLFAYVNVAAYDAVRAGVPTFVALLSDVDPAVRTMAAYQLAWFPENAAETLDAVRVAAVDPEDAVAATAGVALGLLGEVPPVDPRPLARWAHAVAVARVQGSTAADDDVQELLRWVGADGGSDTRVPFLAGDLAGYAARALKQVGPGAADARFEALLARVRAVSGSQALVVLQEVLEMAFTEPTRPTVPAFAELEPRQQRVVRVLADSPDAWLVNGRTFGNVSILVRSFGLPGSRDELLHYAA